MNTGNIFRLNEINAINSNAIRNNQSHWQKNNIKN